MELCLGRWELSCHAGDGLSGGSRYREMTETLPWVKKCCLKLNQLTEIMTGPKKNQFPSV